MVSWNYSFTEIVVAVLGICFMINLIIFMLRSIGRALTAAGGRGTSVVFVKKPHRETQVQSFSTPAAIYDIKDLGDKVVELDIRTHSDNCELVAYWGVTIKDFPWNDGEPPHEHKEEHLLGYKGSHRLRLNVKDCELGDQPRTHYHLVTSIRAPNVESLLYSIYHLYGCSLKTSVLKQYLKSESGKILIVKKIFNESRCVICMDAPASYTLLPCRHSCICSECMPQIQEQCPICRVYIEGYFITDAAESL